MKRSKLYLLFFVLVLAVLLFLLQLVFEGRNAVSTASLGLVPRLNDYYQFTASNKQLEFPLNIVWWSLWFRVKRFNEMFNSLECPFPEEIPVKPADKDQIWCRHSHDRSLSYKAPLLAFHARDVELNDLPDRLPGQKWVLMTQESPMNDFFPTRKTWSEYLSFFRLFDVSMSYRLDSHIPMPYFADTDQGTMDVLFGDKIKPFSERRSLAEKGEATVLWLGTNCGAPNERHNYIKELSKFIKVDSLGKCQSSGPYPEGVSTHDLMSNYKFYLAVENSNCDYYVTEKLLNAFLAGAIPIVSGPPGVNGSGYAPYVPTHKSVIYLDNYPDPKLLAEELKKIDADETLWNERQDYRKTKKYSESFKRVWNGQRRLEWGICGLCRRAAREKWQDIQSTTQSGGLSIVQGQSVQADFSCRPRGVLRPYSWSI